MFALFPENLKSIPKSFSGKKLRKCNTPDFKFYQSKFNFYHLTYRDKIQNLEGYIFQTFFFHKEIMEWLQVFL